MCIGGIRISNNFGPHNGPELRIRSSVPRLLGSKGSLTLTCNEVMFSR